MLIEEIRIAKNDKNRQPTGGELGIIVGAGIIFLFMAVPLLFLIAWQVAEVYEVLLEVKNAMVIISGNSVVSSNEGKLVYVRGIITADETLHDPEFDISANGLVLHRIVKMYQWVQYIKKEEKNGVTFQSYVYQTEWVDHVVDSKNFNQSAHKNPNEMPYQSNKVVAKNTTLGAFKLPESLVAEIKPSRSLAFSKLPSYLANKAQIIDGYIYMGKNPQNPEIGDISIRFALVEPTEITIMAQQVGNSFKPYVTSTGKSIEVLTTNKVSIEEMLYPSWFKNILLGFMLLLLSFVLLFVGVILICNPLMTNSNRPYLTSLTGLTRLIITFLIIATLTLFTTASAWVTFWPGLALKLLLVGFVCLGLAFWIVQIQKKFIEESEVPELR